MRRRLTVSSLVLLLTVAGCSSDPGAGAGHTHTGGGAAFSLPVGDGTSRSAVGYTMAAVALPARAGTTGEVRFRIDDFRGEPVTEYLVDQTKDLHAYIVREDLEVFRHVHPTIADDGTWTAPVSLPGSGAYRVIAEFVARDAGGNGDHLILGRTVQVSGGPRAAAAPGDPVVQVEVAEAPSSGQNGLLRLVVRDARERPVRLDTYLGTFGHVTGFNTTTGSMIHLHPLAAPEVTEDGSELTFHTEIEEAGEYRLFVQVRVDGFLHTVPVTLTVRPRT